MCLEIESSVFFLPFSMEPKVNVNRGSCVSKCTYECQSLRSRLTNTLHVYTISRGGVRSSSSSSSRCGGERRRNVQAKKHVARVLVT